MLPVWMFDTFSRDLDKAIYYTLLWGLEGVVLRYVGNGRVPDIPVARVVDKLGSSDLLASAIEPGIFEGDAVDRASWLNDLHLARESITLCRRIGRPIIVASCFQDLGDAPSLDNRAEAFQRLSDTMAESGITAAVRTNGHDDQLCTTVTDTANLSLALSVSPDRAPPQEFVTRFASRVAMLFVDSTDLTSDGDRTGWLADLLVRFSRSKFSGPICMELPLDAGRQEGLSAATALIHDIRLVRSPPR